MFEKRKNFKLAIFAVPGMLTHQQKTWTVSWKLFVKQVSKGEIFLPMTINQGKKN